MKNNLPPETFIVQLNVEQLQDLVYSLVSKAIQEKTKPAEESLSVISLKKLMEQTDFCRQKVYDLIEDGVLKPVYLGGVRKPLFRIDDVKSILVEKQKEA
jgi:hypothetical protein